MDADRYTISLRMPGELSALVKQAAAAHERSVSGEIRAALREHVADVTASPYPPRPGPHRPRPAPTSPKPPPGPSHPR